MNRLLQIVCALLATGASNPTIAADSTHAEILACLRDNIPVTQIGFGVDSIDERSIRARIRNETSIPLGGVWLAFSIWADGRPQPIYSASIRPAATIAGGLMPGEELEVRDFHFMSDREKRIAKSADALRLTIEVENAADGQMNGFLPHPRMGSWTRDTTVKSCHARES